jgi:hypothetical protein
MRSKEAEMFEAAQEPQQRSSNRTLVLIFMGVAAVAVATVLYVMSRNVAKPSAPVVSAAAVAAAGNADAVHDLKVLSARMEKDPSGTTAVWLVDIDNKSKAYTYSSIQYETTYVGADNSALLINKGTIALSIAPGEQKRPQVRDVLYPAGTSWYKFRIVAATPTVQ